MNEGKKKKIEKHTSRSNQPDLSQDQSKKKSEIKSSEATQCSPIQAKQINTVQTNVSLFLHARINARRRPPANNLLLHTHRPPIAQPRRRPRRNMEPVLLPGAGALLRARQLRRAVQRLNIQGRGDVVALARSQLVVLVAAPEDDVGTPVRAVGRRGGRVADGRLGDVLHDGGRVRAAAGEGREADGDCAAGFFVVFEERGEGGDFGGRALDVCPAVVAEGAGYAAS
jgi:hypothetical protein